MQSVTGVPRSLPTNDHQALVNIAKTHCAGLEGAELDDRLAELASEFARAQRNDRYAASTGYAPKPGLAWLDTGRYAAGAVGRPGGSADPAPSHPDEGELLDAFRAAFASARGEDPVVTDEERQAARRLLHKLPPTDGKRPIDRAKAAVKLAFGDDWFKANTPTLSAVDKGVNKWIGKANANSSTQGSGRDATHERAFAGWKTAYKLSSRKYGEYVASPSDDDAVAMLIASARAAASAHPVDGGDEDKRVELLLAHWFKSFLRDDGGKDRWLMDRRHGIKHLPSRLTEYGYPNGWSDAVASGAPAASGAAQRGEPPVVLTEADKAARSDAMARLTRGIGGGHVGRSGEAQAAE